MEKEIIIIHQGGEGSPSENNNNENKADLKDENNEQGNANWNSNDEEIKCNGQTKDDFNNKETNIPKGQIKDNKEEIMSNVNPGEIYNLKGDGYEVKVAHMGQNEEGSTYIDFLRIL